MMIALRLLLGAGRSGVRSGIRSVVRSVVRSGPDPLELKKARAHCAIPHPRTAPDKVEERRSCAPRVGAAGCAAYAALADGTLERARMGALEPRRGASDLTSGGIDGLMDDHATEGVACDAGLSLPADLNRRRPPAHLAEDAAGAAGALLRGDGGLARSSPPTKTRPPAPASTAPACSRRSTWRARGASTCCSSTASTASPQGAPARRAVRGVRPARRRPQVGDRAVRHRLRRRADDAADARRLRRVRTRHHRRPRHRRTRTQSPRRQMDERPHPLRLPPRQRHQAARPRRGERARRQTHLPPLRRREARHDRDRPHARSGSSTGPAQTGLVTERAATDPRQPRLPQASSAGTAKRIPACTNRSSTTTRSRRRRRSSDVAARTPRCGAATRPTSSSPGSCAVTTAAAPTSAPAAHGRNGRYTYYACSTRYKYGPSKCNGDRLPKDRLEAAVLTQLAELYRDGHLIEQALADLANVTESERPELEEQLASTRAEIARVEGKLERYFEGFEDGRLAADLFQDRVRGHRDRLETLREREADLTARLATHAHTPPDGAALASARRPTRSDRRRREPRASQGATPAARQGHPSARPPPDHPHLQDSGGGSHNTS